MNQHIRSPSALSALHDPTLVLQAALDRIPRVAVVSSLGPQTLVILDLLHTLGRTLPVVLLDTGLLFAETYALRRIVEQRYGLQIRAARPPRTVEQQAEDHGHALWARDPDRCCALRKVAPLREVLTDLDGWITGLRRDQSPTRAHIETVMWDEQFGRWKINPLAHWTRAQVFDHLHVRDIPYNPLLDDGFVSVGCTPCSRALTDDDDPANERAGRWAETTKTECGLHWDTPEDSP